MVALTWVVLVGFVLVAVHEFAAAWGLSPRLRAFTPKTRTEASLFLLAAVLLAAFRLEPRLPGLAVGFVVAMLAGGAVHALTVRAGSSSAAVKRSSITSGTVSVSSVPCSSNQRTLSNSTATS